MVGFFPFLLTQALAMPPVVVALGSEKEKEKVPQRRQGKQGGGRQRGKMPQERVKGKFRLISREFPFPLPFLAKIAAV